MAELDLEDIEGNYLAIKGTPRYVSGEESQLEWLCEQLIAEVKRLRGELFSLTTVYPEQRWEGNDR